MAVKCVDTECPNEGRVALRITRPARADLRVMLYMNAEVAPVKSARYCNHHAVMLMEGLVALAAPDETYRA